MENFVITIARQYGSGGRTVGQMLAKRLGVPFYGKEIIQMASDESGIDVKLFGQVEEGTKVKASLFNKTGLYKGALIAPDQKGFISDENIFNYQAKVVNDLAEKEPCVIVGRCVNYVFRDRPNTLRVFIHAPWEFRVLRSPERRSAVVMRKLRSSFAKMIRENRIIIVNLQAGTGVMRQIMICA